MDQDGNTVIENRSGRFYRGDDGIIQIVSYPTPGRTTDDARETLAAIAELCRGQRHPVLADIRNSAGAPNREERQTYMRSEAVRLISALALVVNSPLSRIIASFFLGISKLPCPTQVFISEKTAIQWLRGFVAKHEGAKNP